MHLSDASRAAMHSRRRSNRWCARYMYACYCHMSPAAYDARADEQSIMLKVSYYYAACTIRRSDCRRLHDNALYGLD
eukprot:3947310-Pyramimonas_sp.AAC.3